MVADRAASALSEGTSLALPTAMKQTLGVLHSDVDTSVLHSGRCEVLKASVHGAALGIAALCAAYNSAAWLVRRQHHLGINAVLYSAMVYWEYKHVMHHVDACAVVEHPLDEEEMESLSALG